MKLKRSGICLAVLVGLMFSASPASAAKKAKHATGVAKLGVHAVTAAGHSTGRVRLSIRGTGHAKKHMIRYTNRRGRYTSGALATGAYTVVARRHGMRSAVGTMGVTGAGTHVLTLHLVRRGTAVVVRTHTRSAHTLGTKAKTAAKAIAKATRPPANHVGTHHGA